MSVTDPLLTDPSTRERAIRELASAAAAVPRAISVRVAVVRSPAGAWRVISLESESTDAEKSVPISVFCGETAETEGLLWRVTWAVNEVAQMLAAERSP